MTDEPLKDWAARSFTRRYLDAREVTAIAPLPWDIPEDPGKWTPDDVEFVRYEIDRAYVKLRGLVYAENLGRDTHTVDVAVHVVVHVATPGPRIWWKPWKRRPDVVHRRGADTTAKVDVTRITWANLPDAPKYYPDKLGNPVRFVEYEGTQHYDR